MCLNSLQKLKDRAATTSKDELVWVLKGIEQLLFTEINGNEAL